MGHIKKFRRVCDGGMAIPVALATMVLMGLVGTGIDYSRATNDKAKLQTALDAAVLAAAVASTETNANRSRIGQLEYDNNAQNPCNNNVFFAYDTDASTLTATTDCQVDTWFMGMFGKNSINLRAHAVATYRNSGSAACLLTLEPSEKEAVMINSDSEIVAPGCMIQVNSTDSEALVGNSNGDITADEICVTGGASADGSSDFSPSPNTCPAEADPLASLPVPDEADDACDHSDRTISSDTVLSPGVFCDKIGIDGADVTLMPGIYVIRDGELSIDSGGSLTGTNVMIYLTGGDNTRLNINSGSHLDLKGLTTGPYAGLAVFQSRTSDADFSILNSDSSSSVEGVIYLPNTGIQFNSNGSLFAASLWTVIIAKTVELNSASTLNLNADYATSAVPVPSGFSFGDGGVVVRLVH